ncbi:MAG: hypothetical protein MJ202_00875 [Lentisphaeria bacterium]|nr:hypothetical protein [Lentisphaeria bacterium]
MAETLSDEFNLPGGEREYGPQPLADVLAEKGLTNHQVVAASTEQLTHKMLGKACRGRYVSPRVRQKIQRAVNAATGEIYTMAQLFNY